MPVSPTHKQVGRGTDESFELTLDCSAGAVGMQIDGATLEVTHVDDGGILAAWNRMHPSSEVLLGDRVVEVNGRTDPGAIVEELDCAGLVRLRLARGFRPVTERERFALAFLREAAGRRDDVAFLRQAVTLAREVGLEASLYEQAPPRFGSGECPPRAEPFPPPATWCVTEVALLARTSRRPREQTRQTHPTSEVERRQPLFLICMAGC